MRAGLFMLSAAILLSPPGAAAADLPPIVFQVQPLERALGDLRTAADLIGGDKGTKAVNDGIKELLGEKGFDGLDIGRPIVGYVVLTPKPADITAVVALPITGHKEFLDLCERVTKEKLQADGKDKTLYEIPTNPALGVKLLIRFVEQYAYIGIGTNPGPHLTAKAVVPMPQLYDPADQAVVSARLYFDRIPLAVKLALPGHIEEVKKKLVEAAELGQEEWLVKPVMAELDKLLARYTRLAAGADVLTARLRLDVPTSNVVVEATLTGKPNSELAQIIAGRKPTRNQFAGLLNHPTTVAGFKTRLPLFEEEIRAAAAAGLEAGRKEALKNTVRDIAKPSIEELFKGLIRTVKTGQFDIAGAVRGPDANGWYTAVGAVAFEDPSALEKEFRKFFEKDAPAELQANLKWDAAKVGTISIHQLKIPPAEPGFFFPDFTKAFGGDDCTAAFACAPHGIFAAIGPDAVGTLKEALALKPADSPVLDVVLNPARLAKLAGKFEPNAVLEVERALGTEDKLLSAFAMTVTGGKELKATVTLNLRLLPRAILSTVLEAVPPRVAPPPVAAIPVPKK
jgi:hypothetical protein